MNTKRKKYDLKSDLNNFNLRNKLVPRTGLTKVNKCLTCNCTRFYSKLPLRVCNRPL